MSYLHRIGIAALAVVTLWASAPNPVAAESGFTRQQNSAYAKLAVTSFRSNRFFDLSGNLNNGGEDLRLRSLALYAEYGVLDSLTVSVDWQALRVNSFENTSRVTGTGDLRLGFKYGLTFGAHHVAAVVAPEFPTGDPDAQVFQSSTLASGEVVQRGIGLPTGDGEFNLWTRLAYSLSLHRIRSWVSADFGVNWRTKGFAHQMNFGAELGHSLFDYAWLKATFRGQIVPSSDLRTDVGFIFGEGTEYLSVGAGVGIPIPRTPLAVTFDWEQIVGGEQNVYAGPLFVVGVSFECGPRTSPDARTCE